MATGHYSRVLLKLSGDFMAGESGFGVDPAKVDDVSRQIREACTLDVEIAIVIGAMLINDHIRQPNANRDSARELT